MAKQIAKFDMESAKLIGKVVDRVQHTSSDDGKWPSKRPGTRGNDGFWAKITGKEPSGWKYSWKKLEPKDTGKLGTNDDYPSGQYSDETMYAVEARYRSKWVLQDEIVWMTPSLTQNYLVFDYVPDKRSAKLVSASTLTKATLTTPGQANTTLRKYDAEANSYSDGEFLTVYNDYRTEVKGTAGGLIIMQIEYGEGVWWVIGTECSTS
jgi:hypothetical protein